MIHYIEDDKILSEVTGSSKLVVLDFFAEWCGPCQMLTPILKELSEEYKDKTEFYKVNVDESQVAAMRYGVTAMPTLIFFKNGEEVERQVGFIEKEGLQNIIEELTK